VVWLRSFTAIIQCISGLTPIARVFMCYFSLIAKVSFCPSKQHEKKQHEKIAKYIYFTLSYNGYCENCQM
jgi:hypothetical protein